jgi:hypothetical protein
VTFEQYGKHMTEVYHKSIKSIKDPHLRAEALQPIWDYADSLEVVENTGEHKLKSVVANMQSAKDQFTTLVSSGVLSYSFFLTSEAGGGVSQFGANRGGWGNNIHGT